MKPFYKKALASAVYVSSGVILANLADSHTGYVFSWRWFHHVLIEIGSVVLVSELHYLQQWAKKVMDSVNGSNGNGKTA